ncbi:MAG: acyl--CoA ligase [Nitrospirota bacterium]|nr:acyl--CoA ligase [Nitrospirota bacterium]
MPGLIEKLLTHNYDVNPSAPFLNTPRGEYCYAAIRHRSLIWSSLFQQQNIKEQDVIAFVISDPAEFIAAFFGAIRIGAIVLPLDPLIPGVELQKICTQLKPKMVLTEGPVPPLDGVGSVRVLKTGELPASTEGGRYGSLKEYRCLDERREALYLLTSGTTGSPKCIVYTYERMMNAARLSSKAYGMTTEDLVFNAAPLFHSAGIMPTLAAVESGAQSLCMAKFLPKTFLAMISRHRPSIVKAPAFMYQIVLKMPRPPACDLGSVRRWYSGSSKLTPDDKEGLLNKYGIRVREMYATTETSLLAVEQGDGAFIPHLAGIPVESVKVRIESDGRVAVNSPGAGKGYFICDRRNSFTVFDPWLFTGDVGYMDKQNRLFITGRADGQINVAGKKVSTEEVKLVLAEHPSVCEAEVIGIDDDVSGMGLVAFVVLHHSETAAGLREFMKHRISDYKIPKHIILCKSLPRGKLNKVSIHHLKKLFLQVGQPRASSAETVAEGSTA